MLDHGRGDVEAEETAALVAFGEIPQVQARAATEVRDNGLGGEMPSDVGPEDGPVLVVEAPGMALHHALDELRVGRAADFLLGRHGSSLKTSSTLSSTFSNRGI